MFDSFTPKKASWQKRAVAIGSIVAHAGLAVGLIVYSVFHVEELPPPEVTLTFFNAPPPPPPPPPPPAGGGEKRKTSSTKPKIVPTKSALVQPTKPEDKKPVEKEDTGGEPGGVVGGVVGGVAGGVVGGVIGGVVGGVGTAPPPPPPAAQKMVPSFVFQKDRIAAPEPHLPSDFTSRHPKETVSGAYRICVDASGRVSEIAPVRSIQGADDAVMQQVRSGWIWKPQPLPLCTIHNFQFKIN